MKINEKKKITKNDKYNTEILIVIIIIYFYINYNFLI